MQVNFSDILNTVIDNGRVTSAKDGFDVASLVIEIEFVSSERGLSPEETKEAVEFAIAHTAVSDER